MNLKDLFDEVRTRGEKLKDEILDEVVKSKTLHKIVSNENFISAVSRVIETKDEVKRAIKGQVTQLLRMMDVPNGGALSKIGAKIAEIESSVEKLGAKKIAVRPLSKGKKAPRAKAGKSAKKTVRNKRKK